MKSGRDNSIVRNTSIAAVTEGVAAIVVTQVKPLFLKLPVPTNFHNGCPDLITIHPIHPIIEQMQRVLYLGCLHRCPLRWTPKTAMHMAVIKDLFIPTARCSNMVQQFYHDVSSSHEFD